VPRSRQAKAADGRYPTDRSAYQAVRSSR